MEIIKDLPEVFEEFAEQRKNSFLGVKKLKDQGVPVIGSYCTYFPQEIATAMGAASVSLCSTSDETIPDAACHTYNVETRAIRNYVNGEKGLPYINVETDYSQADVGQLNTRIAAFIEML